MGLSGHGSQTCLAVPTELLPLSVRSWWELLDGVMQGAGDERIEVWRGKDGQVTQSAILGTALNSTLACTRPRLKSESRQRCNILFSVCSFGKDLIALVLEDVWNAEKVEVLGRRGGEIRPN